MKNIERKILKLQKKKERLQKDKLKNNEEIKKCDEMIEEYQKEYNHQLLLMYINNKEINNWYTENADEKNMSMMQLVKAKKQLFMLNSQSEKIICESASIQNEISCLIRKKRILELVNVEIEYKIFDIGEEINNIKQTTKQKVYKRSI